MAYYTNFRHFRGRIRGRTGNGRNSPPGALAPTRSVSFALHSQDAYGGMQHDVVRAREGGACPLWHIALILGIFAAESAAELETAETPPLGRWRPRD